MDEAAMGMLLLCITAVVVSAASHLVLRRYALASVVSAVVSTVLFQCFAYIHAGYLDPFFLVAFVVAGALAFGIALIVGIPFLVRRRKRPPGNGAKWR